MSTGGHGGQVTVGAVGASKETKIAYATKMKGASISTLRIHHQVCINVMLQKTSLKNWWGIPLHEWS